MSLRVISRASTLAVKQVHEVMDRLAGIDWRLETLQSYGDLNKQQSLLGDIPLDFFTRELDQALLAGSSDIAIHSAKDLPFPLAPGLHVLALLAPADPSDSLVSRDHIALQALPPGARIGTSSPARREQILALRPDVMVVDIRGTIEERLALIDGDVIDALIVATCALDRLGLAHRVTEKLLFKTHFLQGRLAVVGRDRKDLRALFAGLDDRRRWGRVSLVGAGPGDPGLLTLRAMDALNRADVIVYDDLVNMEGVFQRIGCGQAELVYVGKRKASHYKEQHDIQALLYDYALVGKNVVRLKGGDPFIFGRGGEELHFLQERLLDPEVIPGITAAQGAAAYAGLPLTERGFSSSVAFLTAHPLSQLKIPDVDTLVFYMGASVLQELAGQVIASGKAPDTAVLLVERATQPDQTVRHTTLQHLENGEVTGDSPLIVIIGDVASPRLADSWFSRRSKVLCTGLECESYRTLGEVTHQPLIEIQALSDYSDAQRILTGIRDYDWIVFTSFSGVEIFFRLLAENGQDARRLASLNIASVGKRTSLALQQHGIRPDLQPAEESAEGVLQLFAAQGARAQRVLVPRSDKAMPRLLEGLSQLGHEVNPLVLFKTTMPPHLKKVDLSAFSVVVFTSPSTVRNFHQLYGEFPLHLDYVVRGETTQKELLSWNASVNIVKHRS